MENNLLNKLQAGKVVFGTCFTSISPIWPSVAQRAGLDFVFLDTEHIPLERIEVSQLCHTFRSMGISPIVRIPSADPFRACQMIDAGAEGVVAAYLETPEQVRTLVGAIKYRPLKGEMLEKLLINPAEMDETLKKYLQNLNRGNMCIANIESVPALNNLEAMLSVQGLDAVFIGPHDLSVSLGLPEKYDHPVFEDAVKMIIHTCRKKGLAVGIHFSESPERQLRWMKEGVNIVIHSFDIALFSQRLMADLKILRPDDRSGVGDSMVV